MAQQITIDIVAETKKLTEGVNDAKNQVTGLNDNLKGVVAAAGAAASAFVLKQGVTFLKQGIDEAKEAKQVMTEATTTFGAGSTALAKITADAEKFGKAIAVDNDEIIKLATQLGARLPADAKILSAELVNLAFDVEAFTAGAISAETVTNKLAKALADGEVKAADLEKIIPGLTKATYDQAESLSKAGKNQEALTLIIDAAQKKYGNAAENNVTATQKFDVALANLKEQVGEKVLPIVEKFINALTFVIDKFSNLPGPVQNFILGLTALIAIGGPFLTFLASAKTALITLGIVKAATTVETGVLTAATAAQTAATTASTVATTASTVALNLLKIALAGLGIGLVIAAIVLLVQNWDNITEAVGKFWEKVKDVVPKAWAKVMEFKDKVVGYIDTVKDIFDSLPGKMFSIGKNIVMGLWDGMQSMVSWLKSKVTSFFKNLVPDWAEKALGIASPSKVFAGIGKNIVSGLASTFNIGNVAKAVTTGTTTLPKITSPNTVAKSSMPFGGNPINITINAGLGTNGAALGRQVSSAIKQYGKVSTKAIGGGGGGGMLVAL